MDMSLNSSHDKPPLVHHILRDMTESNLENVKKKRDLSKKAYHDLEELG